MRSLFAGASLLVLAGCGMSPAQQSADMQAATAVGNAAAASSSTVRRVVGAAQLYCGIASTLGPITVAVISAQDPTHAPIAVTTKAAVDAACAVAGGIAVSPPPAGVVPPLVAIPGPVAVVAPAA